MLEYSVHPAGWIMTTRVRRHHEAISTLCLTSRPGSHDVPTLSCSHARSKNLLLLGNISLLALPSFSCQLSSVVLQQSWHHHYLRVVAALGSVADVLVSTSPAAALLFRRQLFFSPTAIDIQPRSLSFCYYSLSLSLSLFPSLLRLDLT